MKKFKDVEYSQLRLGLYLILIGLLIVVFLPILKDSISSILTGKEFSFSIRTEITSIILAFSTIILVIITAGYTKSTKELLDEQVKLRKIASFEKVLENVYSPLNNALNKFRLSNDSLPKDRIPENYNSNFNALNGDILKISDKYYHLINQKIKNRFNDVWKSWDKYKRASTLENYNLLNSSIDLFNAEITEHFNIEKKSLNSLQQHQDDINSDNNKKIDSLEKEPKYNAITKALTAFMEYAKKNNFIKYSIIRFPQLMLLSFAFTLSAGAQKIDINNWIYYLLMVVLSFFLTFLLAIYDCIFHKVLEKP